MALVRDEQSQWPDDPETDFAAPAVVSTRLWLALLGIGWVLLELTADPVFVVIAACSKFGWNDVLTAFWLRRRDPNRRRGRTHFWFYVANGLWKVTIVAFGLSFVIIIISGVTGEIENDQVPKQFVACMLLSTCTLFLSATATWIAVAKAWWGGVKVWVNSTVHRARRSRIWPPEVSGNNHVNWLVVTAFIPGVLIGIIALALVALVGIERAPNQPGPGFMLPMFGFLIGVPITILWLQDRVLKIICVESPLQCWSDTASLFSMEEEPSLGDDSSRPEDNYGNF